MPKLPAIKPKVLIKILLRLGFVHGHGKGSHMFFFHQDGRTTTIPFHNKELPKGTLLGILKDIKIDKETFVKFLTK